MMPRGGSNSPRLTAAGPRPSGELSRQLQHVTLSSDQSRVASKPSSGELLEEEESSDPAPQTQALPTSMKGNDFFWWCTLDHLTPDAPLDSDLDADKENAPQAGSEEEEQITPRNFSLGSPVVTPPPCIRNPYMTDPRIDDNVFCSSRCIPLPSGPSPSFGADCFSRYHTDFHETEKIGQGHFGVVFKVLRRIEGCLYAVKQTIKQLHSDNDMSQALREVQTLVSLGKHENIVGYFSSWFESEKLYIQMELCDRCLSMNENEPLKLEDALDLVYQVCKALDFIHERGIAHLDVKPDNIYVTNGVYKLGDFGCATLIDRSLTFEEGDTRYMPLEMMNGKVEHLDKVDIFSLGAAIYELMRGRPIPKTGAEFTTLREGKIPLVPGWPMQLQSLIKSMMDPDPVRRPSAKEILRRPIFDKHHKAPSKI